MSKPIAGQDKTPFGLGGFLVDAVNINGTIQYNVNIYKQRSDNVYDIIDNNGIIHQFIQITTVDKNHNTLDPTLDKEDIASIIPNNTFFIKAQDDAGNDGLVSLIQLNKAKLSTGANVYHPMENLKFGLATASIPVDFKVFTNSPQPAHSNALLVVYVQFRNADNQIIRKNLDVTFSCDDSTAQFEEQKNNINGDSGVYSIGITSNEMASYQIKVSADGHEFANTVTVSYLDDSEDHDYGLPVMDDEVIAELDKQ